MPEFPQILSKIIPQPHFPAGTLGSVHSEHTKPALPAPSSGNTAKVMVGIEISPETELKSLQKPEMDSSLRWGLTPASRQHVLKLQTSRTFHGNPETHHLFQSKAVERTKREL